MSQESLGAKGDKEDRNHNFFLNQIIDFAPAHFVPAQFATAHFAPILGSLVEKNVTQLLIAHYKIVISVGMSFQRACHPIKHVITCGC